MNNSYNYQDYMQQAKQNMNPMPMQNPVPRPKDPVLPTPMLPGDNQKVYSPYEGFIKGNMFPSLYTPYRNITPFEIKPMNEQAEMLTTLDSLGFAMIDLNLYLDIYPEDRSMIELYNNHRKQYNAIKSQYEMKFGPLTTDSEALDTFPWIWVNRPWPWENN